MRQRALEVLSVEECFELLRTATVGRLVFDDELGPVALPVNFVVAGRTILFRVEGGAKRDAVRQDMLAFEVDEIDERHHTGWSVLLRGRGREVPADEVPHQLRLVDGQYPRPWASGQHDVWLQVLPFAVTGRRLGEEQGTLVL